LELAGLPLTFPDSFFRAFLHQFHLNYADYSISLPVFFNDVKNQLYGLFSSDPFYSISAHGYVQCCSDYFNATIILYEDNTRFLFPPRGSPIGSYFTAHLYQTIFGFDSVVRVLSNISLIDPSLPTKQNALITMCTWNLRGATTEVKQKLIDFEISRLKIGIACVQETHLRCSKLDSTNYTWHLGPQYQSRASRGIAFLISKSFQGSIKNINFITPNIGVLTLRLPFTSRDVHLLNVHKYSDTNSSSALETGK
jgi:hypothetical protein